MAFTGLAYLPRLQQSIKVEAVGAAHVSATWRERQLRFIGRDDGRIELFAIHDLSLQYDNLSFTAHVYWALVRYTPCLQDKGTPSAIPGVNASMQSR